MVRRSEIFTRQVDESRANKRKAKEGRIDTDTDPDTDTDLDLDRDKDTDIHIDTDIDIDLGVDNILNRGTTDQVPGRSTPVSNKQTAMPKGKAGCTGFTSRTLKKRVLQLPTTIHICMHMHKIYLYIYIYIYV